MACVSRRHFNTTGSIMAPHKKYDVKFKLNIVRYADHNRGEEVARQFGVDPKRVREWKKNKTKLQELAS